MLLIEQKIEKSFDMVGFDGFLHGITSLPTTVQPSDWLESVWVEDQVKNQADAEKKFGLSFAYYNQILSAKSPRVRCDGSVEQSMTWLKGFTRAFIFDAELLLKLLNHKDVVVQSTANLFFVFSMTKDEMVAVTDTEHQEVMLGQYQRGLELLEKNSAYENIELLKEIISIIQEVTRPNRRKQQIDFMSEFHQQTTKIGRNEPCPCGSGRKYKHCHGK